MTPSRPRILVVADERPGPPTNGYRIRVEHVVRALAEVADLDVLCVLSSDGELQPSFETELGASRVSLVVSPWHRSRPGRAVRWLQGTRPRAVSSRDWGPARAAVPRAAYDLVWWSHPEALLGLGDLVSAEGSIVDLDALHSELLRLRRGLPGRSRASRVLDALEQRRWEGVEASVLLTAGAVVVCSEPDRLLLGGSPLVIPNGYDLDPVPPGPTARGGGLLMVGTLWYPPNEDACRWFVQEVLPRVRDLVPQATLTLVGEAGEGVRRLAAEPGVSVVGRVEDVTPHLRAAAAMVAPLRYGGGTRVKLLEAFAHRVPAVATSVGAYGLDVLPGQHLLIADDAGQFAAACARVLTDQVLAQSLTDAAHALWQRRYRWDCITPRVQRLALDVVSASHNRS